MNKENTYKHFLLVELPDLMAEGMNVCFEDMDVDPEVSWKLFREGLRKIKKKHTEMYLDYLETDSDIELPESEIVAWRNKNGFYDKE